MTIDELKIRKAQLDHQIKSVIKEFQEETKVKVSDVEFERTQSTTISGTILYASFTVKITLDL